MDVFLLWHVDEDHDGVESALLIGVYTTAEDADSARGRALSRPGLRDSPEWFHVRRYTVGEDHLTEGFVAMTHEDAVREFQAAGVIERIG